MLSVLLLVGCSYNNKTADTTTSPSTASNTNSNNQVAVEDDSNTIKAIDINGINQVQEISSKNEIDLNINGMGHNITVLPNTKIRYISVNGQNILINIPIGSEPVIEKNGIDIQIKYY